MKRFTPLLLAIFLFAGACASGNQPTNDLGAAPERSHSSDGGRKGKGKQRKPGGEDPRGASADGKGTGGGNAGEDRDGGTSTNGGSGTRKSGGDGGTSTNRGSGTPYPDAGTYTFAQSGYEEFCDSAGRCDREKLPSRQPVKLAYEDRSGSSATVVTEQRASDSRVARTWTSFTPSGAHITKVYVLMEYSGFRFERTYVPQPAVEAMRFPFTGGEGWSGKWQASTSGSYSVKVGGTTKIEVGGRGVTAYRIDTATEFRGDFQGKSSVTAYYDVDTKALIAAKGVLNVTSQFGRYSTAFDTKLLDGPGY